MSSKIKNIIPYLVMCVLLTAIAIYLKSYEETDEVKLLENLEREIPSVAGQERNLIIIDARTPDEYDLGHLKGAVNIPHTRILEKASSILPDKNALIIVYCKAGVRAGMAKESLEKSGYKNIVNLNERLDKRESMTIR